VSSPFLCFKANLRNLCRLKGATSFDDVPMPTSPHQIMHLTRPPPLSLQIMSMLLRPLGSDLSAATAPAAVALFSVPQAAQHL